MTFLAEALAAYEQIPFTRIVDRDYGDDPDDWPDAARRCIGFAHDAWLKENPEVDLRGKLSACVHFDGLWWCVFALFVERRAGKLTQMQRDLIEGEARRVLEYGA